MFKTAEVTGKVVMRHRVAQEDAQKLKFKKKTKKGETHAKLHIKDREVGEKITARVTEQHIEHHIQKQDKKKLTAWVDQEKGNKRHSEEVHFKKKFKKEFAPKKRRPTGSAWYNKIVKMHVDQYAKVQKDDNSLIRDDINQQKAIREPNVAAKATAERSAKKASVLKKEQRSLRISAAKAAARF